MLAFHRSNFPVVRRPRAEMRVRDIEIATHVPKKFRFPLFTKYVIIIPSGSSRHEPSLDYAGMWERVTCEI